MDRQHLRGARLGLPFLVLSLAALGAGCGGSNEQQLLDRYFQAARLRDNTTLGNIATAQLSREQGVVQSYDLVSVTEEQRRPLRVKDYSKAHDEARAAADDLAKRQKAYQDENIEAIARVIKAERATETLKGNDAAIQAAWNKWRQDTAELAKKVSAARTQLSNERQAAELSVMDPRQAQMLDLTQYDGELITKQATINANVQTPDNQTAQKRLVVTFTRAELKGADGKAVAGKWVISEIRDAGAAAS